MKKLFATLFALCTIIFSYSQDIPNSGFEDWTNDTVATNWTSTFDVSTTIEYMGYPIPVTINYTAANKIADSHTGNFAMRIHGSSLVSGMMLVPGICHLGDFDTEAIINTDFDNLDLSNFRLTDYIHGGIPFTSIPSKLSAWIKYFPTADTMQITVLATRWINNTRETVASGTYTTGETLANFTAIEINIDTLLENATPDTLNVIIATANSTDCSQESEIIIDDITLESGAGITNLSGAIFTISPNPAADYLHLSPASNAPYQAQLFDINGKMVWNNNSLQNETNIPVSNLSKGIYILKFNQNGEIHSQKVVIK